MADKEKKTEDAKNEQAESPKKTEAKPEDNKAEKSLDEIVAAAVAEAMSKYTEGPNGINEKFDNLSAKIDDKLSVLIEAGAVVRDDSVDTSQVQTSTNEFLSDIEIKPLEEMDFSYFN